MHRCQFEENSENVLLLQGGSSLLPPPPLPHAHFLVEAKLITLCLLRSILHGFLIVGIIIITTTSTEGSYTPYVYDYPYNYQYLLKMP